MKHLLHIQRIILITCLICGFTVTHAFGQEDNWLDDGNFDTGWYDNHIGDTPFEISTAEELAGLAKLVNEGNDFVGKEISLSKDIKLGKHYWTPIGFFETSGAKSFKGTFDGSGKEISGLSILGDNSNILTYGLFGCIEEEATIRNVILKYVEVVGGSEHESYTGALVGMCDNITTGVISDCLIIGGKVAGGGDNSSNTGGLIGKVTGSLTVMNCANSATVEGGRDANKSYTGGLIGFGLANAGEELIIRDCYNSGNIIAGVGIFFKTGGLAGWLEYIPGTLTLTNCYASGTLDGKIGIVGGLLGEANSTNLKIENCLALQTTMTGGQAGRIVGRTADIHNVVNTYSLIDGTSPGFLTYVFDKTWTNPGGLPLKELEPIKSWTGSNWKFDDNNNYLPWLNLPGAPQVSNPFYDDPTPPAPERYYTITLELGGAIDANYGAGELTVAEGDDLSLQFMPEDRTLEGGDVMLVVDGEETAFKDMGGNYYFTYRLNDIQADHSVLIALREYTVIMPEVKGAATWPGAGEHKVPYGEAFAFRVNLDPGYSQSEIIVRVNGVEAEEVIPDNIDDPLAPLRDEIPYSHYYRIDRVAGPIQITVEGLKPNDPVGNLQPESTAERVYSRDGSLIIESPVPQAAHVYNVAGALQTTFRIDGQQSIALQKGVYIVKMGGKVYKVVVH